MLTSWSAMSAAAKSLTRKHARWPKRSHLAHLSGAWPRHSAPRSGGRRQRAERCRPNGHMAESVGRPQHRMATAAHADGRFAVAVRWRRASGVVRIAIGVVRAQILNVDDRVLLVGVVIDVRLVGAVRCVPFILGRQAVCVTATAAAAT